MQRTFVSIVLFCIAFVSCTKTHTTVVDGYDYRIVKKVRANQAAVVSAHPLASEVGKVILQKGGNAIDAAIAVQYALAVVYPGAGNLGGGGFMVIHHASGTNTTFDYRERAPGQATRDMYLNEAGEAVAARSRQGHLAVGVPGTVAGLSQAHEKYGRLPMEKLIQPAIDLASRGFSITQREADGLNRTKDDFLKYSTQPTAFVKKTKWLNRDTLLQLELAHTLTLIRDQGKAGFYEGETAKKMVAEMERGGGILSLSDLRDYVAIERPALIFPYKDYQIITMGLPSSGGVMMQQMLGMLEYYPIEEYQFAGVEAVQLMTEIERRAYADRTEHMGDPDFVEVPVAQLVDKVYLQQRMADYNPSKPTPSETIGPGFVAMVESEETTHLSVVDGEGNAVSVTTTLNGMYGSRVVVHGAGFILNNEMDDFSAKPGAPNKFGLLGTEANEIEPGKRMLSSMTPTIVLKNSTPYLILGTPGGSTIITSVFQTLVNLLDFNLSVEEAVNNPKFHHQWKPDVIEVEPGFPKATQTTMEAMGYTFKDRKAIGRTNVIRITEEGCIEGVGDKRGDDSAAGF